MNGCNKILRSGLTKVGGWTRDQATLAWSTSSRERCSLLDTLVVGGGGLLGNLDVEEDVEDGAECLGSRIDVSGSEGGLKRIECGLVLVSEEQVDGLVDDTWETAEDRGDSLSVVLDLALGVDVGERGGKFNVGLGVINNLTVDVSRHTLGGHTLIELLGVGGQTGREHRVETLHFLVGTLAVGVGVRCVTLHVEEASLPEINVLNHGVLDNIHDDGESVDILGHGDVGGGSSGDKSLLESHIYCSRSGVLFFPEKV